MKYSVFIDECGEHNLETIDSTQPIFCLGGIIMNEDEYHLKVDQINKVKLKYFSHEGVILHSYKIRRCINEFVILRNPEVRKEFYKDMEPVLASGYRILCVSLDKAAYKQKKGKYCLNPYEVCMGFFTERLGYFMNREKIKELELIAEGRGKNEDNQLMTAYKRILDGSNKKFYHQDFKNLDIRLKFERKTSNLAGLQLADLIAYPYARAHMGHQNPTYELVQRNILYGAPDYNFKKIP